MYYIPQCLIKFIQVNLQILKEGYLNIIVVCQNTQNDLYLERLSIKKLIRRAEAMKRKKIKESKRKGIYLEFNK